MTDITTMSGPQAIAALSRQLSSAIARAEAAERRVADLEGELGRLRDRLADRRWRTSGVELPGSDDVEIRATGWYEDGWYIYFDGDLVDSFPADALGIQWRPIDSDDPAASLRRSWEDVQEGRIHPVSELWDGIDEEDESGGG